MIERLNTQRTHARSGVTRPRAFRMERLKALYDAIKDHEKLLLEALAKDLGKTTGEAYATEIGYCLSSIRFARKHLKKWMKPRRVKTPWYMLGMRSRVHVEPVGHVLIIGPYNYPFHLVIEPLIGAIAAGNTVMVKPSEHAPATADVLKTIIDETFDAKHVSVVLGNEEVAASLLAWRFDHVFFTGSERVGRIVYESAAHHLTPVTLELGGKSPCIVDATANLDVAARRIAFGKWINAGQTCIAPDYLWVHANVKDELVQKIIAAIGRFYPSMPAGYGRIVNTHHFDRLVGLVNREKLIHGFESNRDRLIFTPAIMDHVSWNDKVMQEEVFGPVLPVLTFASIEAVVDVLKTKPSPLALYLFSADKRAQKHVLANVRYGDACLNDTLSHVINPHLPFGGVGASGIGHYHGKHSFETFSHHKSIVRRTTAVDPPIAYPPWETKTKWIRKILK